MLYPQSNPFRQKINLSGYWDFRLDPDNSGAQKGWTDGFAGRPVAVPASWNDQFSDTRDYFGVAWYQVRFTRLWGWEGKETCLERSRKVVLRFGSVNYLAEVWLNGHRLGAHEGESDNWALRQETELSACARFTQHHLANGKIALETCHHKYVTAPNLKNGAVRKDWKLGQEDKLNNCGQFELYELGGNNRVAFKTCAGRFLTAGDGNWESGLEWAVIGETDALDAWEIFTMQ